MKKKGKAAAGGKTAGYLDAREVDRWMTGVSHEFRTPLNSILTLSDLILAGGEETTRDEIAEFMAIIHMDGLRILRLLEKMIALIDIENGKALFDIKPVNVGEVFGSVVESMAALAGGREVNIRAGKNATVMADEVKLRLLAAELLENAFLHGASGTPVTITARASDGQMEIAVANAVPDGYQADPVRVFEKFVQGNENDLTAKPPGLGVGLTLCREICNAMGGGIVCLKPSKTKWVAKASLLKAR